MKSTLTKSTTVPSPSSRKLTVEFDPQKIDALFADVNQCHLPGVAVGVAIEGQVVYRKGFGLANMELPHVLSPSIRMRIGSVTKHFACFAYMLLCEEGNAGIDDPLVKYFPELHPVTHQVTLRQLMGHTSGLRDVVDIVIQFTGMRRRPVSSAELRELYRTIDDVNFAPGASYNYNNGGYVLLAAVIEKITAQPLEAVLWERIFRPIGMYDTLLRRSDASFVANCAAAHAKNVKGYSEAFSGEYERVEEVGGIDLAGAGLMVSTIDDMLRWLTHMDAPKVGNTATWAVMKQPLQVNNGTSTYYGLGLITDDYRGLETLQHGGGGIGSNTMMVKAPAAKLDVICISNRNDAAAAAYAYKILDTCLPGLQPVKKPTRLASGVYRSPASGSVVQLFARGEQQIISLNGADWPYVPDDSGVFTTTVPMNKTRKIVLSGDPDKPVAVRIDDCGEIDDFTPLAPAAHPDASRIVGRYRSESTDTTAEILASANGPRLRATGKFGALGPMESSLECLGEGVWRATTLDGAAPPIAMLWFDSDYSGFHFSNNMTPRLPFRRCRA